MTLFEKWAFDWGIHAAALADLRSRIATVSPGPQAEGSTEAAVQQAIRLEECKRGNRLWRNNNGACVDSTGRQVRYGLANDSSKMSRHIKSSDLIGITPVAVGDRVLGVFTSIECKRPGWKYTGTEREKAQLAWLELINAMGGIGRFATGP